MTNDELNIILIEIYALEPDLKQHEPTLKKLILKMSDIKPDTKFNPAFAAQLKTAVLKEAATANSFKITNFNLMNKKIYLTIGTLAVVAIAIVATVSIYQPKYQFPSETSINTLAAGAFGQLVAINTPSESSSAIAPMGLGGGGSMSGAAADSQNFKMTEATALAPVMSDMAIEGKMIMPYFSYNYEYKGEPLDLVEQNGDVFRRLKGDNQSGRALANLLKGFKIPNLDLGKFSNLRATSLSLMEDKDLGLMINFDFNEDNIYISENWEKWRIIERESCGDDQACWDKWRIKADDVPSDSDLIAISDKFLSDKMISQDHYGDPVVDNNWRDIYAQASNKEEAYVPEYATVIYPLLINDELVRDQSGSYAGLRVTINLLKKAASGLNGLYPYRFESSSYALETSATSILQAAEKGGWNHGWFGGDQNKVTLELGSPEKAYVQWWHYSDGHNDELLVPALIFPVLNPPTDNYYGPRQIIVPLVKEMLNELNSQNQVIRGNDIELPILMSEPTSSPTLDAVPVKPLLRME